MSPALPRRLPRRLLTSLCCTGTVLGLSAAPALADLAAMRVDAYMLPEGMVVDEVTGMATDEDGDLVIAEEGNLVSTDDGLSASVVRVEDRTDISPLVTVSPGDETPHDVTVTPDGDTYFASEDAAVYQVDDGDAEEIIPPEGYVGSPPTLAADSDALYVARSSEITRVDLAAPEDDGEALFDLDSAVTGMHMEDDTLYVATHDDVVAIENPGIEDAEPASLAPGFLEEGVALDVTVDSSGLVHTIGPAGLIRFEDDGPQILRDVRGEKVEATGDGLVVAQESSELLLLRGLDSEDEDTSRLAWTDLGDATETSDGLDEEPEPGNLRVVSTATNEAVELAPEDDITSWAGDEYRNYLPLSLDFVSSGADRAEVYRAQDGTAWFLDGGHLLTFPGDAATPEGTEVAPVTFGQDLSPDLDLDMAPDSEEFLYSAPGDGLLFLATETEVFALDESGLRPLPRPDDFHVVLGISARGDTVHVLESNDDDVRVVTVNTGGESEIAFTSEDLEDYSRPNGLAVAEDGTTYYLTNDNHVLRVRGDDVDVIAGATSEQAVEHSTAATEIQLRSPRAPQLDGAGNLVFRNQTGIHLLVDAANAPVHPDNMPWRVPIIIGAVTVVAIAAAGGLLLWLCRRINTTPAAGRD